MGTVERGPRLTGRDAECGVLDELVLAVRAGESRPLVLYGEAGIGKSALLDHAAEQVSLLGEGGGEFAVVRIAGIESELDLAYAGLHQLCVPVLDRIDSLPPPQREALRTVFGISAGPPPDRFLVALAVLGLLSEAAADRPLLCLVDDFQWLDRASAQVVAFVARRLGAESVGLLVATRETGEPAGLPSLEVRPLADAAARELLDAVLTPGIDAQVRDQLVAEAHGNPLALLELPRDAQLAGGFKMPGGLSGSVQDSFAERLKAIPEQTRRLLLVAAAEPSGDEALVRRAAGHLGVGIENCAAAIEAGLAEFVPRIRFRHPLVRIAAYRTATPQLRRQAHQALALETDPDLDPDRRAWHRSEAAPGADEEIATELERSASRAQARGGLAAAAAFLHRSARMTIDPALRADRALAAAQAEIQTGRFDAAGELLTIAEAGPLCQARRARAALVRARLAFVTERGSEAPRLLVAAARQLEAVDVELSRSTYLEALSAAVFAGRLAAPGGTVWEVARAAGAAPRPNGPGPADLLLDGTALAYRDGYPAGLPTLRKAMEEFGSGMSAEQEFQLLWMAGTTAIRLWDVEHWAVFSGRHVRMARELGALGELALALTSQSYLQLLSGDLAGAATSNDELQALRAATGGSFASYGALALDAFRGELPAGTLEPIRHDATRRGEGIGIAFADWAEAVACNGLGRYAEAARGAAHGCEDPSMVWSPVELVEAAIRSGQPGAAADGYRRLTTMTAVAGTDWGLGIQARCQALLSTDPEPLYLEAITLLGRTPLRVEVARAQLLYGEWLRRERRRTDAREQLRRALASFEEFGMTAFASRTGRELEASGGTARKRAVPTAREPLTAQETQIARLARDGLSNPEIAARLFISARTVQYHLRKVYPKLGITSRSQLDHVLPR
ncbi:AAA family ATPase [Kribbella sp. NPDC051718]|uniref:AAA family ATPase n=1 Tax=Kribbella sp. NPDC051718 TaxID=3155168 RepID=UPI003430400E